ncbi:MAG: hypothetical protein AAF740_11620 [Bacteroidota bacterium]
MKIRIVKQPEGEQGNNLKKGTVSSVDSHVGTTLIKQGIAEEVTEDEKPKPKAKKPAAKTTSEKPE